MLLVRDAAEGEVAGCESCSRPSQQRPSGDKLEGKMNVLDEILILYFRKNFKLLSRIKRTYHE
jgi:hypothetical protein